MQFFLIDRITRWQAGVSAEATKNVALSEDFPTIIFREGR